MPTTATQRLLMRLARIKVEQKALAEELEKVQADLLTNMTAEGVDKIEFEYDDTEYKGTAIYGQNVVYDVPSLESSVTQEQWDMVTKKVLDTEKLEAAVTIGAISADIVATCSEVKDKKPYVLVKTSGNATSLPDPQARVRKGRGKSAAAKVVRPPAAKPKG